MTGARIVVHFNKSAGVDHIDADQLREQLGADLVQIVPQDPAESFGPPPARQQRAGALAIRLRDAALAGQ